MKSCRRNGGVGEMVDILTTLELEKWWSRRNGGHFSNVGVGVMVDCRRSRRNGGT